MKQFIKEFRTEITFLSIGAMVLLIGIASLVSSISTKQAYGAVSDTRIANIATSSTIVVGPQSVVRLFVTKNFCGSRAIGTRSQAVNIAFGGGPNLATTSIPTSPAQLVGFPLTASTTNMFSAANYGCGAVYAYADASTTITLSEFIQ